MGSNADLRASLPEDLKLPERYQLVRRIASGGMASVWCAEDRMLGRRVAIKLLAESYAHDETAVRRFKREARVAARVSGHQNIVTIFDVGQAARISDGNAPDLAFIVMEYLAGGTVADARRLGAISREEAVRWLSETAAALDYAHGQGVIHRDIKPVNLLLDCDRVVHVADFGIARAGTDDTLTSTGMVLGTAAYIAPEQALGRPTTAASDRYALAVTAFELLVGERPFAATQLAAQARQHVEDEPPAASLRNRELPAAVDAVLARGMAKRPEDRWPSAGSFAAALGDALTPSAAPTRAFAATPPTRRRRGSLAAAGAAAGVAGGAFAGARPAAAASRPAADASRPAAAAFRPGRAPAAARPRRLSIGRSLALAALAAALFAVVMIATAGSGAPRAAHKAAYAQRTTATHAATPLPSTAHHAPAPKPTPRTTTTPTTPEVTGTAAAATTPAPSAGTLEAQGHSLLTSGAYQSAIPVLRQALADAPSSSLTYAYAEYDLGRALRLAGDPAAAAQVLYQRLQIPNQRGTVRAELQAALEAMGRNARQPGDGANGHGHGKQGKGAD
jgi:serine/threonine-protein kinase